MEVRHKLIERVGDRDGRFECPNGHRFVQVLIPKRRGHSEHGEAARALMASWWSKTGVNMECPRCEKGEKGL